MPKIGNFYSHFPLLLCWYQPGPSLSYQTSLHLFEGWKGGYMHNEGWWTCMDWCSLHGHTGDRAHVAKRGGRARPVSSCTEKLSGDKTGHGFAGQLCTLVPGPIWVTYLSLIEGEVTLCTPCGTSLERAVSTEQPMCSRFTPSLTS